LGSRPKANPLSSALTSTGRHGKLAQDALNKVSAVPEHRFEIVSVGAKHFDIDFIQAVLQNLPQDLCLFGSQFEFLHMPHFKLYHVPFKSQTPSWQLIRCRSRRKKARILVGVEHF